MRLIESDALTSLFARPASRRSALHHLGGDDLSAMVAFMPRGLTAVSVGLQAAARNALPDRPGIVVAAAPGGA